MTDTFEAQVDSLHLQVRGWFTQMPNADELIAATMRLIPLVQKTVVGAGRGAYKKRLLLAVVAAMLERDVNWPSPEQKRAVTQMADNILPVVVDTAVGVATGEIDLGKAATQAAAMWRQCFPCCFSAR